jgi:hypothetical protein
MLIVDHYGVDKVGLNDIRFTGVVSEATDDFEPIIHENDHGRGAIQWECPLGE